MASITVSRQLGSLGSDIARGVAARLGFRCVWKEPINQAAIRSGSPEVALAAMDELGLLGICPSKKACRSYHQAVAEVISELADAGSVVIVGRAGQAILGKRPDVLHVRIVAPRKIRAERITARRDLPFSGALAQVKTSDEFRRKYLKRFYKVRWDDSSLYDITLNTARLSLEDAVDLIVRAYERRESAPSPEPSPSRSMP